MAETTCQPQFEAPRHLERLIRRLSASSIWGRMRFFAGRPVRSWRRVLRFRRAPPGPVLRAFARGWVGSRYRAGKRMGGGLQLGSPRNPRAASFLDGRNDLPTAIRGPPPPRVAHSTPLGLLYLGTHAFFCRAAGSVVAPGFAVSPRPSGASPKGVCTRLGGFPAPRRKAHGRGASARQPEKSPASWLPAFASSGWQRRLSSAAEVAPALLSLLLGRFSL